MVAICLNAAVRTLGHGVLWCLKIFTTKSCVCVEYLWQWKKSRTCWWHPYTPTVTNVYATVFSAASSVSYTGRYKRCVLTRKLLRRQASRGFSQLSPNCKKKCEFYRSTGRVGREREQRYRSTLSLTSALDRGVFLNVTPRPF